MSTVQAPSTLMLLRTLLRELRVQNIITTSAKSTQYSRSVVDMFRKNRDLKEEREVADRRTDAQNAIALLQSTKRHSDLMSMYYPPDTKTNREYTQMAARRCGLEIPDIYGQGEAQTASKQQ
eukprot:comp11980_c0_seq1/m.6673 comp11980_c0_seq1/g.6673  ORF comp11980_c0_seq1/g.6673 comp11980_c0_seq1/m.6673 type:complete len:122 (-) comp11980_c0_seq1:155-520(-)